MYSEGVLLAADYFDRTPIERSLTYLSNMSEAELAFEKKYMEVAIRMPRIFLPEDPGCLGTAEREALIHEITENAVVTPDNYCFWPCRTDDRIRYSQIQALLDSTEKVRSFLLKVSEDRQNSHENI